MRIAVMQPTYIGWSGFYEMIRQVDQFWLYDTAQYSPGSFHNRNQIRLPDGTVHWLTVPVKKPRLIPLNQLQIVENGWQRKHWNTLSAAYHRAPGWGLLELLADSYGRWYNLARLNEHLIRRIAEILGLNTPIARVSSLGPLPDGRIERIAHVCREVGATEFLEPVRAQPLFDSTHIGGARIEWFDYEPVQYPQAGMEWRSHLSVVDLIAHNGEDSLAVIRGTVVSAS